MSARTGLLVLATYQLGLGLWMVLSPGTFFELLGPFGERNDHYVRDDASWELALAAAAFVAASRPAWRVPVLFLAVVHFGLHVLNHLLDVAEADPRWIGPAVAAALALGAALLVWLLRREARAA